MIDKISLDNARSIDLITFLERYKGFHFRHSNGEYRPAEHTSLAVKSNRLSWYWHSKGIGGYGAIDFLMKIEGYDFKGALTVLANEPTTAPLPPPTATIQRDFILPERAKSNRRAYAYLTITRGLDSKIIQELIQEEKIYEDTKGNAVFVGYDEQGKPRYATLRGTYTDKPFRMDCVGSDKRHCFCMSGSSSRLYTFESAIDCISHATIENRIQGSTGAYRADNRLSLGGTSGIALAHYLQRYKHITELVFCLDNDDAGRKRAIRLAREYADKGYYTRLELPTLKDYNEVLLQYRSKQKKQKRLEGSYER